MLKSFSSPQVPKAGLSYRENNKYKTACTAMVVLKRLQEFFLL